MTTATNTTKTATTNTAADMDIDNQLIDASEDGESGEVQQLLEAGADAGAKDNHALRMASLNGHAEVVKILTDWTEAKK